MNWSELPEEVQAMFRRAAMPDFADWQKQINATGGCSNPIRMRGGRIVSDAATGELLDAFHTDDTTLGYLLLPCGNRRAEVCPACAEVYRWDAYQLIRAGLAGGKGVSESVADHPMLFATLTAPSFGAVHACHKETGRDGLPMRCMVRRRAKTCGHGVTMACPQRHVPDDGLVGQALCLDCYDYIGAVLFNAYAGDLWRRVCIYLRRELASAAGVPRTRLAEVARVSFVKVAEYQARGLIHFHGVFRIDGPGGPDDPPPDWATVILLDTCLRRALATVRIEITDPTIDGGRRQLRFGTQLDTQVIYTDRETRAEGLSSRAVAGYIAKYATKAAEVTGSVPHRIKSLADLDYLRLPPHTDRMIRTCLTEARNFPDVDLRRAAHMLGYGGHCTTKSRRYSTTFAALRDTRRTYRDAERQQRLCLPSLDGRQVEVASEWTFLRAGLSYGESPFVDSVRRRRGRAIAPADDEAA